MKKLLLLLVLTGFGVFNAMADVPLDYGGSIWSYDPILNNGSTFIAPGTSRYVKMNSQGSTSITNVLFVSLESDTNVNVTCSIYQNNKLMVTSSINSVTNGVNAIPCSVKLSSGYFNLFLSTTSNKIISLSGINSSAPLMEFVDSSVNKLKSGCGSFQGVPSSEPVVEYSQQIIWVMLK